MLNKKVRIIKKITKCGKTRYTIQQRHFLFFWWWVDAWINNGVDTTDTFYSLKEAKKHLCYFDGTKTNKREVVFI